MEGFGAKPRAMAAVLASLFPAATAAEGSGEPLPHRLLLTGPPRSGKSTLLLQLAYSRAAMGEEVLYVSGRRERLNSHPPLRPRNASGASDDDVLRRIHIKCDCCAPPLALTEENAASAALSPQLHPLRLWPAGMLSRWTSCRGCCVGSTCIASRRR